MDAFLLQLTQILLQKRLKSDIEAAAESFDGNPSRFLKAFELLQSAQPPIRERLAWTLQLATEFYPGLIDHNVMKLAFQQLPKSESDAERRAMANILRNNWIPDELLAPAFDLCLTWFDDPKKAVAVRVYCLDILLQVVERVPELRNELDIVVQAQIWESAPPAFIAHRYKKLNVKKGPGKAAQSKKHS